MQFNDNRLLCKDINGWYKKNRNESVINHVANRAINGYWLADEVKGECIFIIEEHMKPGTHRTAKIVFLKKNFYKLVRQKMKDIRDKNKLLKKKVVKQCEII